MKVIIIINTILTLLACIQLGRSLYKSYVIKTKSLLAHLFRSIVVLLLLTDFIAFTFNISRITNDFAPYVTRWITVTTVIYNVIMLVTAQLLYKISKKSSIFLTLK